MPKSITEVLLDCYHEGDPAPFRRFPNQSDFMRAHAGQTVKTGGRAKLALAHDAITRGEKLKPQDA